MWSLEKGEMVERVRGRVDERTVLFSRRVMVDRQIGDV